VYSASVHSVTTSLHFTSGTSVYAAVAGKKTKAVGIAAGIGCSVVLILVCVFAFVVCKRRVKATKDGHRE
jgi:hypothetical protein